MFKDNHLNITIQCNLKIVDCLDFNFNRSHATYRPFCKPNNEIAYIHKESNHPPFILRQKTLSTESRLSKHSSNEKIFKESTQIYQEALKKSGYNHQLIYQKSINNKNKDTKPRKRKIIWFNPPYSKNVSTKVGNHKSNNQSSKRCLLCLNEKLAIALHKDDNMLNKRAEIIRKCRHKNKYMLACYDSKD